MKKATGNWIKVANEDFEMMELAWRNHKYSHTILFAQQSVEKITKAYIVEKRKKVPRKIHAIEELIKDANLDLNEIEKPDIRKLSLGFTRVRYPDLSKKYYESRSEVEELYIMAKKVYLWVQQKLKKS